MKLLIVDDEVITVRGLLQGVDWEACGISSPVLVAYDAAQARELMVQESVDLILCDIEMPGESGLELMRDVQAHYPQVACIFLTCHANFSFAQDALRLHCADYLLKPAPYEDIAQAVRRLVEQLTAQRRQAEAAKYGSQWLQRQMDSASQSQGDRRTPKELADEAAAYILDHLADEDLTVSMLAGFLYLNADYLNRIFKRERGIAVGQFIIRERMDLARRLLEGTAVGVGVVAMQTGYRNFPHFVSTFKKHFGCTPTQYREKMHKNIARSKE